MNVARFIGILVIAVAYGLTWYLLIRSIRIVRIIDREGLKHAGEIKARIRRKGSPGESGSRSGPSGPDGRDASDTSTGKKQS